MTFLNDDRVYTVKAQDLAWLAEWLPQKELLEVDGRLLNDLFDLAYKELSSNDTWKTSARTYLTAIAEDIKTITMKVQGSK